MLASVYYKPPEAFVKKIRDRINERLDLENEEEGGPQVVKKDEDEYVDSAGIKRSEYVKQAGNTESYHNYIQGTGDLLGLEEESKEGGSS